MGSLVSKGNRLLSRFLTLAVKTPAMIDEDIDLKLTIKLQQALSLRQRNGGFTLLELLIVMIITGILFAISIPSLVNQIGRARETEATNRLGVLARAQQAYHWEYQQFAPTLEALKLEEFDPVYYLYPPALIIGDTVRYRALALQPFKEQVRNYGVGVYANAGQYVIIICQGQNINTTVEAPASSNQPCTNGGIKLR